MKIREIKLKDLDSLLSLYKQLNPHDPHLQKENALEIVKEIIQSQGFHIFVLELTPGNIVSSCYLNVIPNLTRSGAPYAIIENVVTIETERNKGFGKKLLSHVLDFAWKKGCYKTMLLTGSKKQSVHNFYLSCGFKANDKTAYIARPFD